MAEDICGKIIFWDDRIYSPIGETYNKIETSFKLMVRLYKEKLLKVESIDEFINLVEEYSKVI